MSHAHPAARREEHRGFALIGRIREALRSKHTWLLLAIVRLRRLSSFWLLFFADVTALSGSWNNQFGMWNYEQGNYPAAREEFYRAVADDPRNPAYSYNLASALLRLGDCGGATGAYWQAIQLDPSHEPSYHALARLLIEEGRRDEATQLISEWVDARPHDACAHIEMAWIERENGDLNAAEQSLFRSLAAHPNNPVATGQLGRLYEQMGQRERAAVMYRRSLQADWFQPQVQARLAVLENRGGAIDCAEYATRAQFGRSLADDKSARTGIAELHPGADARRLAAERRSSASRRLNRRFVQPVPSHMLVARSASTKNAIAANRQTRCRDQPTASTITRKIGVSIKIKMPRFRIELPCP